jgi:hypothetical protein
MKFDRRTGRTPGTPGQHISAHLPHRLNSLLLPSASRRTGQTSYEPQSHRGMWRSRYNLVRQLAKPLTAVATLSRSDHSSRSRYHAHWLLIGGSVLVATTATCALSIASADTVSIDAKQLDSRYQALQQELSKFLNEDQIDSDEEECIQRGKPWNSYHKVENHPRLILLPESTEQVSKIVKLCNKYQIPLVPFGGGTSLEGHTLTLQGGVSLDFNQMKKVVELNEDDLDVRVEAGLGYVELNDILRSKGLWFPLDPGPGASIGGMCACRCSGSTAVRYGSMRENVLNLTAVLADGSIIHTGSRARKSAAGYDITRLLIGSEGTLAVITEATLKLHGVPKVSHAVRIAFPGGVFAAATTAKDTLNCGVTIGRCEVSHSESSHSHSIPITPNPSHYL